MRASRILLLAVVVTLVFVVAAFFFRASIAEHLIRQALSSRGLEKPQVSISKISANGATLVDLSAEVKGEEAFAFEQIAISYDLGDLISQRKVHSIDIGPGRIRVFVAENGQIKIPGLQSTGEKAYSGLPFSKLSASDLELMVQSVSGFADGNVEIEFDSSSGGSAQAELAFSELQLPRIGFDSGAAVMDVELGADGDINVTGELMGDAELGFGPLKDLSVTFDGAGQSWKTLLAGDRESLTANASIRIESARADLTEIVDATPITNRQVELLLGGSATSLSLAANLNLAVTDQSLIVQFAQNPWRAEADNGAVLQLFESTAEPLYLRKGGEENVTFLFDLSGARVNASGTIDAETTSDGWFIFAPFQANKFDSSRVSLDETSALARINTYEGGLRAEVTTSTNIRMLSIGRLQMMEAPIQTDFSVDVDFDQRAAFLRLPEALCVAIPKARVTIRQQNTEAVFTDAEICEGENPLAEFRWFDEFRSEFTGTLTAENLRYRIGRTRFEGLAPNTSFEGLYLPRQNLTTIKGGLSGGAMTMNNVLVFSSASGEYTFSLDRNDLKSSADLSSVVISQNEKNARLAPVIGAGTVDLNIGVATFEYLLRTPWGKRLGTGSGDHNVRTAEGQSRFNFDEIRFEGGMFQPDVLAPVLKGIIGETYGAADGSAYFAWEPGQVISTAEFDFDNLTFEGPTRVVTHTIGLNGRIEFADLWPVQTNGLQTIEVSGVDLDALQLESGKISFEMPGDETFRVEEAEFPWFGGALGVYEANASLAGGEAVAPLRADNIDLEQILNQIDIEGLSGKGMLNGVLPLIVENGKARIEGGELRSTDAGYLKYEGAAGKEAAAAGGDAKIAFDILRNLQFNELVVTVNGPLDGRLQFQMRFEGTGEVELNRQNVAVPVLYRINLDAALLELLNQVNVSRDIQLQVERGLVVRE